MGARGLRICMLGGFAVTVGDQAIPETAWRRRAGDLIKLLALAPEHRLHREQVLERLWPGLDPEGAANGLHKSLHAARRALTSRPQQLPAAPQGAPQADLLSLRNGHVCLGSTGSPWIDVEAFEAASRAALSGDQPAMYERALDLYAGDLLPQGPLRGVGQRAPGRPAPALARPPHPARHPPGGPWCSRGRRLPPGASGGRRAPRGRGPRLLDAAVRPQRTPAPRRPPVPDSCARC